jgi:ribosomal protein S18 acetylase RimI-like enzyme
VQIRTLGINDYTAVMDLWKRSGLSSLRPDGRDSREAFVQQLRPGTSAIGGFGCQTVLGLENEGQLIGVIIATHDGRKGWINRLAVDPDHRRRGYAKQLIAAAEDSLRARGITVIAALIKGENEASLTLFQQLGYQLHDDVFYVSKRECARV